MNKKSGIYHEKIYLRIDGTISLLFNVISGRNLHLLMLLESNDWSRSLKHPLQRVRSLFVQDNQRLQSACNRNSYFGYHQGRYHCNHNLSLIWDSCTNYWSDVLRQLGRRQARGDSMFLNAFIVCRLIVYHIVQSHIFLVIKSRKIDCNDKIKLQ